MKGDRLDLIALHPKRAPRETLGGRSPSEGAHLRQEAAAFQLLATAWRVNWGSGWAIMSQRDNSAEEVMGVVMVNVEDTQSPADSGSTDSIVSDSMQGMWKWSS